MIWESTPLMTLIDILTLCVVVFAQGYFWHFKKNLRNKTNLTIPSALITVGLVTIGLLYLSDLIAMWVLPLLVGPESAYAVMEDIQLNYSWILVPLGVSCVTCGFVWGGQIILGLKEDLENREGQASQEVVYRKKTEEKLRESEHLYHSLIEDSSDFIVRCLPNGIRTFVNEAYCLYYGAKREELLGNSFFPLVVKEDQQKIRDKIKGLTPEDPVIHDDHRVIRPDGTMAWHRWSSRGIFDKDRHLIAVQGVGRDVTELKRHEEALRASEEKFAKAFRSSPLSVTLSELESGRYVEVNPGFEKITGYSPEEAIGKTSMELGIWADPEDRARLVQRIQTQGTVENEEIDLCSRSGQVRSCLVSGEAIEINDRGYVIAVIRDITESKAAERFLRQSEEQFRLTFEKVPIGMVLVGVDNRFTEVNEAFSRMLGYSRQELVGRSIKEITHLDDVDTSSSLVEQLFRGEISDYRVLEKRYLKKNGEVVWANLTATVVVRDREGRVLCGLGMVEDITERRETIDQLQDSREQLRLLATRLERAREEERARLAREIHDELGQSITALNFELTWLEKKVPQEKPLLKRIDSMSRLLERTVGEIRRISAELRPLILDDLGLVAAIEWQVKEFRKRTGIKCRLRKKVGRLVVDEARTTALFRILQEALTNVLRHADATQVDVRLERQNGALVLEVCDNGNGLSDKHLDNKRSFGILGMQERILPFGGELLISGKQGEGTILKVQVPLS